ALGAELVSGAAYVCDALRVNARIADADLVVGGEGRLDETTLHGKLLAELASRSSRRSKPLAAIVGSHAPESGAVQRLGLRAVFEARDLEAVRRASSELARDFVS
ncbi:MAG: glycerate kinase, partial [Actinomycetota bacterium]|nr:glycerate kinase [Actinomycetota bacterium]